MSDNIVVSRFSRENVSVQFKVVNKNDVIQGCHWRGGFYEEEELRDISLVVPTSALILDVGANVGNHVVYFAKFCRNVRVIPFEANPDAIQILKDNIELNGLSTRIDTTHLGIAIGRNEGFVQLNRSINIENNLGAASFITPTANPNDRFRVASLDDLLLELDVRPDFIKMDIEGMEIEALIGATTLINKCRPVMYVEVAPRYRTRFKELLTEWNYSIDRTHQRHKNIVNYLCVPW